MILAGGFGTRIRDVSQDIPKPMISIGPYPIIVHIIKHYMKYDIKEFVICLGYKGDQLKHYFCNLNTYTNNFTIDLASGKIDLPKEKILNNCKITFVDTGINSMTGSRISKIRNYLNKDEDFCLTYGDGVSDINISNLIEFHKGNKKILTVTGVRPPGRFGEIEFDKDNFITSFNEKPQTTGGRISGGFFVAKYDLFNYLDNNNDLVFEQDPMQLLAKKKEMMVYHHNGFWHPMDTNRDYKYLNELFDKGKAPWI